MTFRGIVLAAGKAESSLCQLFGEIPTGLVPINGKPVIFYILDVFVRNGINQVYIAVGYGKERLCAIVDNYFSDRLQIEYIDVDYNKKPGSSLLEVSRQMQGGPGLVLLADSYLQLEPRDLETTQDVVYSSDLIVDPEKWCTLSCNEDGFITAFHDKQDVEQPTEAVVGIYQFSDVSLLHDGFSDESAIGCEISELLEHYRKSRPLRVKKRNDWLDFGHIDKYQSAKKKMLQSRVFNSLEFDDLLGTITKRSKNREKLIDEIRWVINLPPHLEILTPRIIEHSLEESDPFVKMEYYSYQTGAEIWLYSSFKENVLRSIIDRILKVAMVFFAEKRMVSKESYRLMYVQKTEERMESLRESQPFFQELLECDTVWVNGEPLKNWAKLSESIFSRCAELYNPEHNTLLHGDFCLSNILYDVNSGIVRLLDPRGCWGEGSDGDFKYDMAKLRHSISGGYDFIVNDLFHVKYEKGAINYALYTGKVFGRLEAYLDQKLAEHFDVEQIRLIEGLLFLSMLPYHCNDQRRQLVMYAKALELLNGVIK